MSHEHQSQQRDGRRQNDGDSDDDDDPRQPTKRRSPLPEGIPMDKDERVRRRLLRFYRRYAPSRIRHIPEILERYGGNEFKLFRMLARKYRVPVEVTALDYNGPDGGGARDSPGHPVKQSSGASGRGDATGAAGATRLASEAQATTGSTPSGWIAALDSAVLHAADFAAVAECRVQMHWRSDDSPTPNVAGAAAAAAAVVDPVLPRVAGLMTLLVAVYAVLGLLLVRRLLATPRVDVPADALQRAQYFRRLENFRHRVLVHPRRWRHALEGLQTTGFHFMTSWLFWLHLTVATDFGVPAGSTNGTTTTTTTTTGWLVAAMAMLVASSGLAGVATGWLAARRLRYAPEPLRLGGWYALFAGPVVIAAIAHTAMRTACATFTTLAQVPFVTVAVYALETTALIAGVFAGYKLGVRQQQRARGGTVSAAAAAAAAGVEVATEEDETMEEAGEWNLPRRHHVMPFCAALLLAAPTVAVLLAEHPAAKLRAEREDEGSVVAGIMTFLLALTVPSMGTGMLFTVWHVMVADRADWRSHAIINGLAPAVLTAVVWPLRFGFVGGADDDELRSRPLLPVMVYLMALAGAATSFVAADAIIHGLFRSRAAPTTTTTTTKAPTITSA